MDGNRAALKWRFRRSTGSAAPFQGGGTHISVTDADGDTFYFGADWSEARKERVVAELNEYLQARAL